MTEPVSLDKALSDATARAAGLKQELQGVERLRKLLEGLQAASPDRPALALSLYERDKAAVAEVAAPALQSQLRELWSEWATRTQEASRESIRTFPDLLAERGLNIDTSSRHPRYSVEQRLVEVELDARKYVAHIRARHGDLVKEPFDPAAVADRVLEERERLLGRPFDAKSFAKKVVSAHAALSKPTKKGTPPRTVMLRDLATQLAKPGKPKLDEFAVDLGRLLGRPEAEGLSVTHTRDTDKGLLLYGLEQGGYVGSLDVRRTA